MVTVQVKDLSGIALDWAVAICERLPVVEDPMGFRKDAPDTIQAGYWIWEDGLHGRNELIGCNYSPSRLWMQGGEIIEREFISLKSPEGDNKLWTGVISEGQISLEGNTGLIAAMRAFVYYKIGYEIDIPANLA